MSTAELTLPLHESGFTAFFERHRRELHVHCYRMLGSCEDAEDLVQETFLRAWRKRSSFRGGSFRAWLYKIATDAGLDVLRSSPRRILPPKVAEPGDPGAPPPPPADLPCRCEAQTKGDPDENPHRQLVRLARWGDAGAWRPG